VDAGTLEEVETLLTQLQQLLVGISIMQDLTPRAKDSLVSFGERLSTRLFAAYLNAQGVRAKQYDAYNLGVTTNDNFVNAEVGGWIGWQQLVAWMVGWWWGCDVALLVLLPVTFWQKPLLPLLTLLLPLPAPPLSLPHCLRSTTS